MVLSTHKHSCLLWVQSGFNDLIVIIYYSSELSYPEILTSLEIPVDFPGYRPSSTLREVITKLTPELNAPAPHKLMIWVHIEDADHLVQT